MNRKGFLISTGLLAGGCLIGSPTLFGNMKVNPVTQNSAQFPNVVFILSDDMGPGDIAVYHQDRTGQKAVIPTPNLNLIAENGIRFTDASTSTAVCAPSRYSIMTGSNAYRCRLPWGVWDCFDDSGAVAPGQKTVANVMKEAGYHTAFFGKWHLGGKWEKLKEGSSYPGGELWDDRWDYSRILGHYPNALGFDYSLQLPNGLQEAPLAFYENGKWLPISKNSFISAWKTPSWTASMTSVPEICKGDSEWNISIVGAKLAQGAVKFIQDHMKEQPDKPFFIYYSSQAVHLPHRPPSDFFGTKVKGTTVSSHGDMIVELDLQVGMIIEELKKTGVYDNTLIIFTSDNGGLTFSDSKVTGHHSANGFRGNKGSMYEGGTRVPLIAMWPGVIPKGKVSQEPVMALDLMATLYALTSQDMPENQAMDSYNLLPLLKDLPGAKGREMILYGNGAPWKTDGLPNGYMLAFRKEEWKLIIQSDDKCAIGKPYSLFNLKDNPYEVESKNLIADPAQQKRIADMYQLYKELRTNNARTTEVVKTANL